MIEQIQALAKERYVDKDYRYHIIPVVKNALKLAERLGADKEVVEIGAYLHDIGRAGERKQYQVENDHHITGARETRKILEELDCEEEFIKNVEHCVLTHRGRKGPNPETLEAEIVNNADAMAHFDTFLDMFMFFMEHHSFEYSVIEIEKKSQRNWEKKLTLPEAKEIVKDNYEAAMLLIKSMKGYF